MTAIVPAQACIEIRGVDARRGEAVLRRVSFEVGVGERVAIIGPHQPSLSLLIRACGGFERVDAGELRVAGTCLRTADRLGLAGLRRRLGYVSIRGGLLSNMTLRGNLELALRYHGMAADEAAATVRKRLEGLGLHAVADQRTSLVEAELQKCFAYLRALLFEPEVLMAEDPSAFLHPQGREIVAALHDEAHRRGITVLVADDDDAFVRPLVDRVISLEDVSQTGADPGSGGTGR